MTTLNTALSPHAVRVNPIDWKWPQVSQTFHLYDKYVDKSVCLSLGETEWIASINGIQRKFNFLQGDTGLFQQKLVVLTQANFSPSSFYKFTYTMLRYWPLFLELLETEPNDIKYFWDRKVTTTDVAKAAKSILKLVARHSLGTWSTIHLGLIKKLSTRENSTIATKHARIASREMLLSPANQSDIVRLLDEKAGAPDLSEWQIEGLAALALGFQHGVRPVQSISLLTNHVYVINEGDEQKACMVSFHEAKKRNQKGDIEMSRQVKPEWAPLIVKLLNLALAAGRSRVFSTSGSTKLWNLTKKVCKQYGLAINYNYYKLRHTGAQMLADAGHGRSDIKNFLGQTSQSSGTSYLRSSRKQAGFINRALGISKLYSNIASIATGKYVSIEEVEAAPEDQQIAGVVGDRLIAGTGLCAKGQSNCVFDPVTSCYNCKKYMPALNPAIHKEAIAGMRHQIILFVKSGGSEQSASYLQLSGAIAGAQKALAISNGAVH